MLGFEKVFNLDWGFEKYVAAVAEELHLDHSVKKSNRRTRTFISSFCPSAELYVKKYHPELVRNILATQRPEELMAAAFKKEYAQREKIDPEKIRVMLLSACTSRKKLKGGAIDHVLTVRELGRIAREKKIGSGGIKNSKLDNFLDGVSAGYADIYKYGQLSKLLAGKIKHKISIGAANGVAEIENALSAELKKEKHYDFLEVMVCPGGCGKGGGQSMKISN